VGVSLQPQRFAPRGMEEMVLLSRAPASADFIPMHLRGSRSLRSRAWRREPLDADPPRLWAGGAFPGLNRPLTFHVAPWAPPTSDPWSEGELPHVEQVGMKVDRESQDAVSTSLFRGNQSIRPERLSSCRAKITYVMNGFPCTAATPRMGLAHPIALPSSAAASTACGFENG